MRVAGFDIATVTGCAILEGTRVVHAEAFRAEGMGDPAIFASWRVWFRKILLAHEIQHAAIEQPLRTPTIDKRGELSPRSSMATYLRLYGLRAMAVEICETEGVPCLEVNQSTWRASFAGNGHATKDDSLRIARRLAPHITSKDVAEAIGVAWHLNGQLSQADMFSGAA